MSTLAGYVEAGETLEHAVVREVFEEVGVRVVDVRYVASQPWPFPSSLMLAFTAKATTTDLTIDDDEIAEARWFTRDELRTAITGGSLLLPMSASVAFYLIDGWFGGDLARLAQ
jgi:NAD+ diphosphatase